MEILNQELLIGTGGSEENCESYAEAAFVPHSTMDRKHQHKV